VISPLIKQFLPFAQENLGFKSPPRLFLKGDAQNAENPLGKTAFYDPNNVSVTLYTTGRHVKDVMRSLAHELVHHTQYERGDFEDCGEMGEGYAQNDEHLREMEREAYEKGNMCFRDWEDGIKNTIYFEHLQKGELKQMSTKDWKNNEIKSLLSEAWGFKMDLNKLNEDIGGAGGELTDKESEEEDYVSKREKEGNIEEDLDEYAQVAGGGMGKNLDLKKRRDAGGGEYKATPSGKDFNKLKMRGDKEKRRAFNKGTVDVEDKEMEEQKKDPEWGEGEHEYKRKTVDGVKKKAGDVDGHYKDYEKNESQLQEDSGEDETWHQWKNEHADDDHIGEIENHLRALRHDRNYEEHEAEHDDDKYEDEGYDRRDEFRRKSLKKGDKRKKVTDPGARQEESRIRSIIHKALQEVTKAKKG